MELPDFERGNILQRVRIFFRLFMFRIFFMVSLTRLHSTDVKKNNRPLLSVVKSAQCFAAKPKRAPTAYSSLKFSKSDKILAGPISREYL